MELAKNEAVGLEQVAGRIDRLRELLATQQPPGNDASPQTWFVYLTAIKTILGNSSNDLSFVSCLMAREYLGLLFTDLIPFDVAAKPQGANGLDIDAGTTTGERIIGEIKTTSPHHATRFGAAQITSLRKDFAKLQRLDADYRFMFVTDPTTFQLLKRSFSTALPGVTIVCLTSGEGHACPRLVDRPDNRESRSGKASPTQAITKRSRGA